MKGNYVQVKKQQGIAYVSFNRADKYNALDFNAFIAIDRVIKQLKKDRDLQVVILYGVGNNFCSGLDIKSVMKSPLQAVRILLKGLPGNANLAQRISLGWRQLPVPVIAAIEGCCFGGGMQIALGADFRVVSPTAQFSIMEAKWGLVPDMAGLVTLREIMPKDQALLLTMTAAVLTADEALKKGLVTEVVVDPMQRAETLAQMLMQTSPDANAAIKLSINLSWTASIRCLLRRETFSQIKLLMGRNRAIAALRQGKEPERPYEKRQSRW
ncbi:crotonase/enoyl-CoA hydratase family protein [Shewanella surugensis]|uniref:Crotonase/enoyl-CoA hydratase family protein n=1 Tax=Shewanella surugensis TaxID=212020 RepID=A0ABT0L631_9GAMM|nr:crotonase/enoyl-CoA hydratase family protein [Shewanella surugensis]MCL1123024.1 crotonase/enoyl-CoA hydratase family protein [Shewanella surugensis]